jgi:hypothetical protein
VNLAGIDPIIKHVFERVGAGSATPAVCVGGLFYRRDTLDRMFDYRTYERVQFEHKSESAAREGRHMTVLDDRQLNDRDLACPRPAVTGYRSGVHCRAGFPVSYRPVPVRPALHRPLPTRPAVAPLRYHGSGVRVSQAAHTRRPVSTAVSIALAGVAALITLWLGFLAHVSGDRVPVPAQQPDRLAVVQVHAGETLQQLAGRVAPDAPTAQVVQRIRELNKLDSAALDAGQTLIAPLG